MNKRALAAFAAVSVASVILLMAQPASAHAAADTAGLTTIAAASAARTITVTNGAIEPDTISGPHYWMYTDDDNPGGRIDFWPNGDVVELCDIQADGYGVYADVNAYTSSAYELSVGGNGKCVVARASQGGVRDLREEACITFVIFLDKSSTGMPAFVDSAAWLNDNDIKANC